MRIAGVKKVILSVFLVALGGCTVKVDAPIDAKGEINNPNINIGTNGSAKTCTITVPNNAVVEAGKVVSILVDVGSDIHNKLMKPPYKISGLASSATFDTQTFSIDRVFQNDLSTKKLLADQIVIVDSNSVSQTCNFTVTVEAGVTAVPDLVCSATMSPTSASINQSVKFSAKISGGTGPFSFSNFAAPNATVVSGLALQSDGLTGEATVKYSANGTATVSATVLDAKGKTAVCSKSVTITGGAVIPLLLLSAAPSATVSVGSTITLTASPSGFTSQPQITFYTN